METMWVVLLGLVCGFAGWNGYLNWRLRRAVLQAERLLREQELERLRIVAAAVERELARRASPAART